MTSRVFERRYGLRLVMSLRTQYVGTMDLRIRAPAVLYRKGILKPGVYSEMRDAEVRDDESGCLCYVMFTVVL